MTVIEKRDTRDIMEYGDRFVRIPGTGILEPCSRCNRLHEVHYVVEHEGRIYNMGGTCAAKHSPEMANAIRKYECLVRATSTLRKYEKELAEMHEQQATWTAAVAEAATLPAPEPHFVLEQRCKYVNREPVRCVYVGLSRRVVSGSDADAIADATEDWRYCEAQRISGQRYPVMAWQTEEVEKKTKRQRAKVEALKAANLPETVEAGIAC